MSIKNGWEVDIVEKKLKPLGHCGQRELPCCASYRLLKCGEKMQKGDQRLNDDCATWSDLKDGWEIGKTYDPAVFVPIRREA